MPSGNREVKLEEIQARLKALTEEISTDLSQLESSRRKELLSNFVSELFLNMAKQDQQEFRQQKVVEGLAAARARGVRLGRARKPLPDNFAVCFEAWQNSEITQTKAAELCGMSRVSFYREANRIKQSVQEAQ